MKKLIWLILLVVLLPGSLVAQSSWGGWYISAQAGYLGYQGDLQDEWLAPQLTDNGLAWSLLIRKPIARHWSLRLQYAQGSFSANDRDQGRLQRSLNVKTDLHLANVAFQYFPRPRNRALQPYLGLGVGYTYFEPYGDLKNRQGQAYYYWSDGSIRNQAETSPNPENAQVITQDGTYETRLDGEGPIRDFNNLSLSLPAIAGLEYRLASRLSIAAEILLAYQFTDYLDGYNLGSSNDWLYFPNLSLSFRLGKKSPGQLSVTPIYLPAPEAARPPTSENLDAKPANPKSAVRPPLPPTLILSPPLPAPRPARRDTTVHLVIFPQLSARQVERVSTLLPDSALLTTRPPESNLLGVPASPQAVNPAASDSSQQFISQQLDSLKQMQRLLEAGLGRQAQLDSLQRLQQVRSDSAQANYQRYQQQQSVERQQLLDTIEDLKLELNALRQQDERLAQARQSGDTVLIRQEIARYDPNYRQAERRRLENQLSVLETRLNNLQTMEDRRPRNYSEQREVISNQPILVPYPTAQPPASEPGPDSVQFRLDRLQAQMDSLQQQAARPVRRDTLRIESSTIDTVVAPAMRREPELLSEAVVYFASGSTQAMGASQEEISRLLTQVPADSSFRIQLHGYSDPSGDPAANQRLSLQRAEAVKQQLVRAGVPAESIEISYHGADPALPPNRWAYGRRVEIKLEQLP